MPALGDRGSSHDTIAAQIPLPPPLQRFSFLPRPRPAHPQAASARPPSISLRSPRRGAPLRLRPPPSSKTRRAPPRSPIQPFSSLTAPHHTAALRPLSPPHGQDARPRPPPPPARAPHRRPPRARRLPRHPPLPPGKSPTHATTQSTPLMPPFPPPHSTSPRPSPHPMHICLHTPHL